MAIETFCNPDRNDCGRLADAASGLLRQCDQLVRGLPVGIYSAPSRILPGGTIGKHLRHVLDHYTAALAGLATDSIVDYDRRERNVPMETDPGAGLASIAELLGELRRVGRQSSATALTIRVMISAGGETEDLVTTLGRELAFATHHGVHHVAMMRGIASEHGVEIAPEIGKAPSTLNNE
ncbi:MAG: DinB family protein, partial [Phycisphaerales bacterium]